jgi:beta-glucanase (GH16 family)
MSTSPTAEGPRNSIRLEGYKRYNRGLFILDVRHMPSGCGSWPAFWLTDEPAWPINGEIDILEGVNTQTDVKTAMHTTKGCKMDDVPVGVKTGYWVGKTLYIFHRLQMQV